MTESTGLVSVLLGLSKWVTVGIGSGVTYALAVVETNPEVAKMTTPDLQTSIIALIGGVVAFALKNYVPSEKKVDEQFRGQTTLLLDVLENRAFGPLDKLTKDLHEHKEKMAGWVATADKRLEDIEKKHSTCEITRPRIMKRQ